MTKHQKAFEFLSEMEIGRIYKVNEQQREIMLDLFLDKYLVLPTHPMEGHYYYFNISKNCETICKHPIE